jgi:hypothetical protein
MAWYGLDKSGSAQGPVEGSCEHDDETFGFHKTLGSSWVGAPQAASKEALRFVELV